MTSTSLIHYSSNGNFSFEFEGHLIHGQLDKNNKLIFIASEACLPLGLSNVSEALKTLDPDEKGEITIPDVTGRRQGIRVVTESGLYHLIFKSKKESATRFRRWVTEEVLPSIRTQGGYISPDATSEQLKALQQKVVKLERGLIDAQQVNYWLGVRQGAGRFLEESVPDGDKD